jgi:hypothetical protein
MQPIASIFPPILKAAQSIAPAATANPGIRLFNASAPRSLLFDSKSLANRFSTTSKTYRNLPKNIVQTHDWRGFFANVPTENGRELTKTHRRHISDIGIT